MRRALAIAALGLPVAAFGAGGSHSVDDANILGAGECEFESWVTASSRAADRLLHVGGQCGVSGVELALAAEPARIEGERSRAFQAQLKWAREWTSGVNVGFSLTPQWDAALPRAYQATTLSALATWKPHDAWQVHANLGRDFMRDAPNQARSGVAADWTAPDGKWLVAAERYVENRTHFARAAVRWFPHENWMFDVGRAQRLRGERPSTWTLAFTRSFGKN